MADELTTSELSREHLALLFRLTKIFNSSLNLETVLNQVMDETIAAVRAERGFIMLRDAEGSLEFQTARGLSRATIDHPEFEISRSVVETVARTGEAVFTSDAQTDVRFLRRTSIIGLGLRSILCVPLQVMDIVTGVMYVDNRLQAGIFKEADLELLVSIASSAAVAIENARLYQVALEKARMEKELMMARTVQTSLLPPEMPRLPGWEFAARWEPAREVAGDFYDFIPSSDGKLSIVVGDVTDKGLPAALFMVFARNIVRETAGRSSAPGDVLTQRNRRICQESSQGLYITLIYASLQPETGEVAYANAGHNPGLHYQAETQTIALLMPTGMPLGIDDEAVYTARDLHLKPGDVLLLYTDGVTEAMNPAGEEFGLEQLKSVLQANGQKPAGEIIAEILRVVENFTGDGAMFDDTTLVIFKRYS